MKPLPAILILLVWLGAMSFVGGRDADDAEITAQEVEAAGARKSITPEQRLFLSHPLPHDATVEQHEPDGSFRVRYYTRPENRQ